MTPDFPFDPFKDTDLAMTDAMFRLNAKFIDKGYGPIVSVHEDEDGSVIYHLDDEFRRKIREDAEFHEKVYAIADEVDVEAGYRLTPLQKAEIELKASITSLVLALASGNMDDAKESDMFYRRAFDKWVAVQP